jgi:ABC-type multidrug transport system fused ATPase/permease subunit
MRTAIVNAIYKKTFTISAAARKNFTTGEITNLMAVDASRFLEVVPFLNTIWSGPFQFFLAIYFLYELVGLSSLAGLLVFFIMVPLNLTSSRMGRNIQAKQMKAKDERILLMNEMLQGIKMLKLYAWETSFLRKITEFRSKEIKGIKQNAALHSLLWLTYSSAPLLVTLATFMCYVFIDPVNNVLTAEKIFGTVAIFNVVRIPMNQFPRFLMEAIKLYVSIQRIDNFLSCTDLEQKTNYHTTESSNSTAAVTIKNASFTWMDNEESPTLSGIDACITRGELIAVVGKIGSGKSSLLSAILGEMKHIGGEIQCRGRISYVAQQAWIQNQTLQDNILFGTEFEKKRYDQVIKACALESDLALMIHGDQTEIGENGINLSGGQKQRVGLARAAYSYSDVVLMDDPLSAVDAHVAEHIFDKLIGPNGLLHGRTRIFVTHNLSFLHKVDRIFLFDKGKLIQSGTIESLTKEKNILCMDLLKFIGQAQEKVFKEENKEEIEKEVSNMTDKQNIICKEIAAVGSINTKHYACYFKSMNMYFFLIVLLFFLGSEAFKVGGNLVLADWTSNFKPSTNWQFIGYYSLMAFLCSFTGAASQLGMSYRSAAASQKIHDSLMEKTMHAPLSFFETNPIGRILNRFTSDIDVLDVKIPMLLRQFLSCLCMIIGTLCVIAAITPIFLASLIPIMMIFIFLQIFFTRTRRQVKRLESIAKSPIFSHFTETINGAVTIRAFNQLQRFCNESERRVANHLYCNYISDMSNRWLSIRVECLGNLIVFLAAMFAFYYRETLSAGLAALSVSYAMQMIDGFGWTIR